MQTPLFFSQEEERMLSLEIVVRNFIVAVELLCIPVDIYNVMAIVT